MTHTKIWHSCDKCGFNDTHHLGHAETITEAKFQAGSHGWSFSTGKSYCPECIKAIEHERTVSGNS